MCLLDCRQLEFMRPHCLWSVEGRKEKLFDMFDESVEAGSFGRKEQNKAQAKGIA
jgi:hypothetical protein